MDALVAILRREGLVFGMCENENDIEEMETDIEIDGIGPLSTYLPSYR